VADKRKLKAFRAICDSAGWCFSPLQSLIVACLLQFTCLPENHSEECDKGSKDKDHISSGLYYKDGPNQRSSFSRMNCCVTEVRFINLLKIPV
jgi:hypothetical protein